jgi:hypothetical protein
MKKALEEGRILHRAHLLDREPKASLVGSGGSMAAFAPLRTQVGSRVMSGMSHNGFRSALSFRLILDFRPILHDISASGLIAVAWPSKASQVLHFVRMRPRALASVDLQKFRFGGALESLMSDVVLIPHSSTLRSVMRELINFIV